jgi:hypothetical protein
VGSWRAGEDRSGRTIRGDLPKRHNTATQRSGRLTQDFPGSVLRATGFRGEHRLSKYDAPGG